MNRPRSALSFLTAAIGLAITPTVQAAATPMVVTASRFQTSSDSLPANTTIISAAEISDSNATTLSQVLERQAGVNVQDLFGITGARSTVDLGGFGATAAQNTLILLNGHRLNDIDLSGANLAAIPLESIARIEIRHGSSAVLYGDNATSGVINIVTKNGYQQEGGSASVKFGSFMTRGLDLNYGEPQDDSAVYVAGNLLRSDGYRDKSSFDQKNLAAELNHTHADFIYGFRFNGNYEGLMLPGALNEADYEINPRGAGLGAGEYANQKRNSLEGYISADLYAAEINFSSKHQDATLYGKSEADLSSWSMTPRQKRTIAGHDLSAGLDIYYSALDAKGEFADLSNPGATLANSTTTTRTSYAFYITDGYNLDSASSLNLGLRRQWVNVGIQNAPLSSNSKTITQDDSVTAWEIGLNHRFNDTLHGYLHWANSFRFAVLDEMWSYVSGAITPLKPQTGRTLETGATLAVAQGTRLDINLFRMTLSNEIGYDSSTFTNINFAGPTRHQGADLNLHRQINPLWQANLGYAWREATFTAGANAGKSIPQIPAQKLTLNNGFKLSDHGHLNIDLVYIGRRYFGDDFANAGKQLPGNAKINLGYNHTLKNWKMQLRINNLTDRKTADNGYYVSTSANPYFYYPLPGRAYYLTVGREF